MEKLRRILLHVPVGILAVIFGYWVGWWLAIIFAAGFWLYEVNQDSHVSDQAYRDLKGFLWGCGAMGMILLLLKLGSVL